MRAEFRPAAFQALTCEELKLLQELDTPAKIQRFLDSIPYSTDPIYRSPRSVLRDRRAHCFDGALFAAAALRFLGHPPRIVDLKAVRDDDHLLAIFKRKGRFGAVAKSNFVGLRFREPIYRSLRELVISYFDSYYNLEREKTLRGYTIPLDLRTFDHIDWMTSDDHLETIADRLDQIPSFNLLDEDMVRELNPVDERTYTAGMQGADPEGIYRVEDDRSNY
ncbi:MAG TPA: transglutaminase domain-containing protein [Acidobacteriota bacterium]|nr:transglutaminase domain-containing protein [Acidobacteriota bacterium]